MTQPTVYLQNNIAYAFAIPAPHEGHQWHEHHPALHVQHPTFGDLTRTTAVHRVLSLGNLPAANASVFGSVSKDEREVVGIDTFPYERDPAPESPATVAWCLWGEQSRSPRHFLVDGSQCHRDELWYAYLCGNPFIGPYNLAESPEDWAACASPIDPAWLELPAYKQRVEFAKTQLRRRGCKYGTNFKMERAYLYRTPRDWDFVPITDGLLSLWVPKEAWEAHCQGRDAVDSLAQKYGKSPEELLAFLERE